jgi:hypothetical protein
MSKSSQPTKPTFATIEPTDLAAVTGGRRASTSRSTATDDKLMDTLNSIESAIKDVGKQPKPDTMGQIMPLLALRMMQQPAAPQVIHVCKKRC